MILVLGSLIAKEGTLAEALALSREHVARSKAEPGCVSHGVHIDAENPNRLVFVEEWQDRQSLLAHFQVPASREFARSLGKLASHPPQMVVYEATQANL